MAEGRRARKKGEVRSRLLDAARTLFASADVDAVSVDAIAEAADVARTTFFNHFESKAALVDELAGRMRARQLLYLAELRAQDGSLGEGLDAWFGRVAASLRKSPALSRVLLVRALSGGVEPTARAAAMAEVHAAYRGWLAALAARGELASSVDVAAAAELVSGTTTMLVTNWVNDPDYPLEARARAVAALLRCALAGRDEPHAAPATRRTVRARGTR